VIKSYLRRTCQNWHFGIHLHRGGPRIVFWEKTEVTCLDEQSGKARQESDKSEAKGGRRTSSAARIPYFSAFAKGNGRNWYGVIEKADMLVSSRFKRKISILVL